MQSATPYVNIAAYKFVTFDNIEAMRPQYQAICAELSLKGTILLTPEGINMFLSGTRGNIDKYLGWLRSDERFADIEVKESLSEEQSHKRMLVKIKKEIITMRMPLIKPELGRAPAVEPTTLKRWLDQGHDDKGRPVVMVDTRNAFEVDVGTFNHTIDYRIDKFTEFPEVIAAAKGGLSDKTVVTFCTGGIRCEKATAFLKAEGVPDVFHLRGGVLRYLETTPEADSLWAGECFVFDERVAVGHGLATGSHSLCRGCRMPVSEAGRASARYVEGVSCDRCADARSEADRARYLERTRQVELADRRGVAHIGAAIGREP